MVCRRGTGVPESREELAEADIERTVPYCCTVISKSACTVMLEKVLRVGGPHSAEPQ